MILFDKVIAKQTIKALAFDQLLAATIVPHLRGLIAGPGLLADAIVRVEAVARAVPAAWIEGALPRRHESA